MIAANELRIGNWVMDGKTKTFVTVDGLQFTGRIVTADDEYDDFKRGIDPEPIPLTPEILEKAGFVERVDTYELVPPPPRYYELNGYQIIYYFLKTRNEHNVHYVTTTGYNVVLTSLHQLQNLYFALTGTELDVKL